MTARLTRWDGPPPERAVVDGLLRHEGLSPRRWGNGPGDTYASHVHGYHKVLYCVAGSIVFHTAEGDVGMGPGDRLDVEPGTEHAATVGSEGVECLEAAR